jgi:large subunit ribosomal protein L4
MEPTRWAWYNEKLLNMPLRKDILHRAVIFEADGSRQGSASAKHRTAVHGSNRKIQPQKGLGRARAGDKKSPIRRGGGKAHGPHPRDFSTKLQRKVYDIAWRTALSHRYRKGELVVLDNSMILPKYATPRFLNNFFEAHRWGQGNGRSMMVTGDPKSTGGRNEAMTRAMAQVGEHGMFKDIWDVDVKDLLETGRVIIEKDVLDTLLFAHASDLGVVANLRYALHAKKEDFLQYAHPMSDAQLMQANEAMLGESFDEFEEEMEDGFELEDLQIEESRVEIR